MVLANRHVFFSFFPTQLVNELSLFGVQKAHERSRDRRYVFARAFARARRRTDVYPAAARGYRGGGAQGHRGGQRVAQDLLRGRVRCAHGGRAPEYGSCAASGCVPPPPCRFAPARAPCCGLVWFRAVFAIASSACACCVWFVGRWSWIRSHARGRTWVLLRTLATHTHAHQHAARRPAQVRHHTGLPGPRRQDPAPRRDGSVPRGGVAYVRAWVRESRALTGTHSGAPVHCGVAQDARPRERDVLQEWRYIRGA